LATFKELLHKRFPNREQIYPVLSMLLFVIFTWTLYRMFFYLPSWLDDYSLPDALVICAYVLVFSLLESLVMLGFFLIAAAILPAKYFRKEFAVQASLLTLILGASAFLLQRKMKVIYSLNLQEIIVYPVIILALIFVFIFLTSYVLNRLPELSRILSSLVDRFTVFLYVYFPLSLVSSAYVIIHRFF
jgi:hypothetical protein